MSQDFAAAVAGRTVAMTNKTPAPNRFRQFSKPKIFDVYKQRYANMKQSKYVSYHLLANQLMDTNGADTDININNNVNEEEEIITTETKNFSCLGNTIFPETLSMLRLIIPNGN